jgi:hypothetical protein
MVHEMIAKRRLTISAVLFVSFNIIVAAVFAILVFTSQSMLARALFLLVSLVLFSAFISYPWRSCPGRTVLQVDATGMVYQENGKHIFPWSEVATLEANCDNRGIIIRFAETSRLHKEFGFKPEHAAPIMSDGQRADLLIWCDDLTIPAQEIERYAKQRL